MAIEIDGTTYLAGTELDRANPLKFNLSTHQPFYASCLISASMTAPEPVVMVKLDPGWVVTSLVFQHEALCASGTAEVGVIGDSDGYIGNEAINAAGVAYLGQGTDGFTAAGIGLSDEEQWVLVRLVTLTTPTLGAQFMLFGTKVKVK